MPDLMQDIVDFDDYVHYVPNTRPGITSKINKDTMS